MNDQDLSGKIVFKVKLENEIKKLVIHNDDINYNELLLMMQRIFSNKIKPNDEFTIKYTDEENDLITLSNDSDVLLALQNSKILKLTIFLNNKEEKVEDISPSECARELHQIRLSIDRFLDKFDSMLRSDKFKPKLEEIAKQSNDTKPTTNGHPTSILNVHKEFDPFAKRPETENSNRLPAMPPRRDSRAHTPDSVGSLELSPNPKKHELTFQNSQNVAQQQYSNLNLSSLNGNAEKQQVSQQPQQSAPTATMHELNPYLNQQQPQQQQFQPFSQQQPVQQVPPPQQVQQPHHQTSVQQPPIQQHPHQSHPQQHPQQQQQQPPNQFYPGPNQAPKSMSMQQASSVGFQNAPNQPQMDSMPQQQQMFQHQQQPSQSIVQQGWQPQQQAHPQQQQQQPPQILAQQSPMMNQPASGYMGQQQPGNNPYAKPSSATILHRPPSTTIYQQGYK